MNDVQLISHLQIPLSGWSEASIFGLMDNTKAFRYFNSGSVGKSVSLFASVQRSRRRSYNDALSSTFVLLDVSKDKIMRGPSEQ
ncbi:uncharacterized protein N7500_009354 [Penicillium coprophilum]|uniref:uncharacterized protein n=1 Tax=Penicillium coprophilum TaxID=36646 RepID=UPI0023906EFB|nr:uncharacterized protein N7500_009354 [Penicillium coprophilum]KAJ5153915.1 hypothetical protein N7500_009354 [Penicillium coprophilum]